MSTGLDADLTQQVLTEDQIQEFVQHGVLVVSDILTTQEVNDAMLGLEQTLIRHGVDTNDLEGTGRGLAQLSSTNGSGGVLDLFYDDWKMAIASHPRLFRATTQLWEAAYCHKGEQRNEIPRDDMFKWHPYGPFDPNRGFMYVDRVGFRLPTVLAEKLGNSETTKKSKPLQRSLTPHLDCCPDTFFSEDKAKWRPIQCFVSLTTNLDQNTGGFEAAPGFHRDFEEWAASRPPSIISKKFNGVLRGTAVPAPCLGEYTHIRPREDASIMTRMKHIPVTAGSAVFWDNRIPHGNSYRNDSDLARAVVYCSFLPDVAVNRPFVDRQLHNFLRLKNPSDQWINSRHREEVDEDSVGLDHVSGLSALGRQLLGVDD
jgi:hypothetical protein